MNKSFKVIWNKHRAQHVVTDEHKRSHGKEKSKTLLSATTMSFVVLGSSLALLFGTPTWAATTITPANGWNATTVAQAGSGVYNITTSVNANDTGINKFSNFQLDAHNIANLQLGDATRLLNFVDTQVQIGGVLNAVKNGKIGGDIYFLTPQGFVVSSTGVVNATRLGVSVITQKAYDEYVQKNIMGLTTNETVNKITQAELPLASNGVITINGSINVGNEALLAAANIEVSGAQARITSGVTNFSNLVNIPPADGNTSVNAGINDLQMTVDSATGDILLVARADGSLTAKPEDLAKAVYDALPDAVIRGFTSSETDGAPTPSEESASSGVSETVTQHNIVTATITVGENAKISAKGKAVLEAAASAGAYKAGSRTGEGGTQFEAAKVVNPADVTATVQIDGEVTAEKMSPSMRWRITSWITRWGSMWNP